MTDMAKSVKGEPGALKSSRHLGTAVRLASAAVVLLGGLAGGFQFLADSWTRMWAFMASHLALTAVIWALAALAEAIALAVALVRTWRITRLAEGLTHRLEAKRPTVQTFATHADPLENKETRNRRTSQVRGGLASARETIYVIGIANEMITSDLEISDILGSFFQGGGSMRAVFINPLGANALDREDIEGHETRINTLSYKAAKNIRKILEYQSIVETANRHRADYMQSHGYLLGVSARTPHRDDIPTVSQDSHIHEAKLQVRVYSGEPRVNMVIVDGKWAFVHYYGVKSPGTDSPVVEVDVRGDQEPQTTAEGRSEVEVLGKRSHDALSFYCKEFDDLWEMAQELPTGDWMTCEPQELATVLQVERTRYAEQVLADMHSTQLSALRAAKEESALLTKQLRELSARDRGDRGREPARFHIFQNKAPRRDLVASALAVATEAIDAVGVVNEWVTTDLIDEDFLMEFFERGGRMRALFIDPRGEAVRTRELAESKHQKRKIVDGDFARRTQHAIDTLRKYREGNLEVRVYEREPTLGLVMVDDKWALVHQYGLSAKGVTTPTLEVDGRGGEPLAADLLRYYKSEFEALWVMNTTKEWEWP